MPYEEEDTCHMRKRQTVDGAELTLGPRQPLGVILTKAAAHIATLSWWALASSLWAQARGHFFERLIVAIVRVR